MVTIRTVITLTARLIIDRLSITVADTGLTIGGTAVGFIIGTATSAKVLSRLRGAVLSRAASRPFAGLSRLLALQTTLFLLVGE